MISSQEKPPRRFIAGADAVGTAEQVPTQQPTHECTFGTQIEVLHENIRSVFKEIAGYA
jgi:hypothetical protein